MSVFGNRLGYFFFHSRTVHPDIIKSFIYPTECTTRLKCTLKFYINVNVNLNLVVHSVGLTKDLIMKVRLCFDKFNYLLMLGLHQAR